jgi:hypothetical protein
VSKTIPHRKLVPFIPLFLGSLLVLAPPARADDEPDFDAARTPDSPAFTLLGIAPTEIERPNTPQQVAVSLAGFARNGGAIEIAPYWLFANRDLTLSDYRDGVAQLGRNVSVSLGTTASDTGASSTSGTRVAVGIRTSAIIAARNADTCAAETDTARELTRAAVLPATDDPTRRLTAIHVFAMPAGSARVAALDKLVQQAADEAATRCVAAGKPDAQGLAVELAAATSFELVDDELTQAAARDVAAWASLAYRAKIGSLIGLVRVRRERVAGGPQYLLVSGARGVIARGRAAGSLEAVAQRQIKRSETVAELPMTYRVTARLDVRVSGDSWFTLSFGKDLGEGSGEKVFSLANLSWGFGDPQVKAD